MTKSSENCAHFEGTFKDVTINCNMNYERNAACHEF